MAAREKVKKMAPFREKSNERRPAVALIAGEKDDDVGAVRHESLAC